MMAKAKQRLPFQPPLLELPEQPEAVADTAPESAHEAGPEHRHFSEPEPLPLFSHEAFEGPPQGETAIEGSRTAQARVPLRDRLMAGVFDLGIHVAVLAAVSLGLAVMGLPPGPRVWPALGLLLLVFSFLYTVIPLAFWGQTPGMVSRRLVARSPGGERLSFGQTTRRWLGGVMTLLLAGLPLLLASRGRSLSERLSGSETVPAPVPVAGR